MWLRRADGGSAALGMKGVLLRLTDGGSAAICMSGVGPGELDTGSFGPAAVDTRDIRGPLPSPSVRLDDTIQAHRGGSGVRAERALFGNQKRTGSNGSLSDGLQASSMQG